MLLSAQAGACALCALVLIGLHRAYRRAFLLHWGLAWLAAALHFVGLALTPILARQTDSATLRSVLAALTYSAGYAHVATLISGTWMIATGRPVEGRSRPLLHAPPLALGYGLILASSGLGPEARLLARDPLLALVGGLAFLGAAYGVSVVARREPALSRWLVVALLSVAGVARLIVFKDRVASPKGPWADSVADLIPPHLLTLFLLLTLPLALVLWFFEDERRNLVRTARALEESEEHRRRSEHMEAVGRLAGGVAHDFNNLLTAITGHAELLLLRAGPGHPDREDLLPIARAAARAAERVRELLTFSRRQPLRPRNLVLDELLGDIQKMLARLLGENVFLELQLGAPTTVVHADPAQLELALINLVSNARDAIRGSGVLRVRTSTTRVEPSPAVTNAAPAHADTKRGKPVPGAAVLAPGSYLLLEISDDGCGIAPEALGKVFEPFYTTKPGKGTGLGLASVYGIVTQSGGEIRVESALGQGTTFRIWLPVVAAVAAERPVEFVPVAPGQGGEETILLVEDEAPVRHLAQRLLAKAGYRVVVCESGDEARERLRADPLGFQLLFSDVVMPGLPLQDLLETVNRDHPGLRVLLMSGYSEMSIGQQGVDVRAAHFVQKPFTGRELLDAVRAALDARSEHTTSEARRRASS